MREIQSAVHRRLEYWWSEHQILPLGEPVDEVTPSMMMDRGGGPTALQHVPASSVPMPNYGRIGGIILRAMGVQVNRLHREWGPPAPGIYGITDLYILAVIPSDARVTASVDHWCDKSNNYRDRPEVTQWHGGKVVCVWGGVTNAKVPGPWWNDVAAIPDRIDNLANAILLTKSAERLREEQTRTDALQALQRSYEPRESAAKRYAPKTAIRDEYARPPEPEAAKQAEVEAPVSRGHGYFGDGKVIGDYVSHMGHGGPHGPRLPGGWFPGCGYGRGPR